MPELQKPIHAKPSLFAYYFYDLKEIAVRYGYNLVIHGSMKRDLDLIAIPRVENIGSHEEMIEDFIEFLGGSLMFANGIDREDARECGEQLNWPKFKVTHHGRMQYVINLNRGELERSKGWPRGWNDPQYYLDISVIPANQ